MTENSGWKRELSVELCVKGPTDVPIPRYMSQGAAGMDLAVAGETQIRISPGSRALVPTGIRISLPAGYEGQIRPRSGLALEHGLTVLNSPGTVDSDYRGEIKVVLANLGQQEVTINPGERVAQLVIAPVVRVEWKVVDDLPPTSRGDGGFGHTGQRGADRE